MTQMAKSLYKKLNSALEESSLASRKFLPQNVLEAEITKQIVKDELDWRARLFRRGLPSWVDRNAKKVFAILVLMGETQAIKELFSEKVTDSDLPLYRETTDDDGILWSSKGQRLRSFVGWRNPAALDNFLDKQWLVLSPVLDTTGRHTAIYKSVPLPVLGKERVGMSKSSTVYRSAIHSAYREDSLQGNLEIAIKEFNDYTVFSKERKILEQIHDIENTHLIQYLTTWEYRKAYYILFPWANGGNLRELWKRSNPTEVSSNPILWSLQQMLGLSSALRDLYNKNCRHGDLKPENILYFKENGRNSLVIADVGVSKIHDLETKLRNEGTSTKATTPSYEPPEVLLNQNTNTPRSRKYDIWSIGCIFLEFIIWLIRGIKAIKELHKGGADQAFSFYELADHKTPIIRPVVIDKMNDLRKDIRCRGTAMEAFIDLIAERLLLVDADERDKPEELYKKLEKIVRDAEAESTR